VSAVLDLKEAYRTKLSTVFFSSRAKPRPLYYHKRPQQFKHLIHRDQHRNIVKIYKLNHQDAGSSNSYKGNYNSIPHPSPNIDRFTRLLLLHSLFQLCAIHQQRLSFFRDGQVPPAVPRLKEVPLPVVVYLVQPVILRGLEEIDFILSKRP
jgi:hypothetical protein